MIRSITVVAGLSDGSMAGRERGIRQRPSAAFEAEHMTASSSLVQPRRVLQTGPFHIWVPMRQRRFTL